MSLPEPKAWCKLDVQAWPLVVEMLTNTGQAWPVEVMQQDIRWMLDQVKVGRMARLPGRPTLRKRWNAPDRAVRSLLQSLGGVQPVSNPRPADVQPVSSPRPARKRKNPDNEPELSSPRPADVQPVSSPCPADVHTRVGTEQQSTEHRAQKDKQPAGEPSEWTQLADAYGAIDGCVRPRASKTGNGAHLRTLIQSFGLDDATTILRWWAYCDVPESRAVMLREGGYKLPTLARAEKRDSYHEMALQWRSRGSPGDPAAKPPQPPTISVEEQIALDAARIKAMPRRERRRKAQ